ncbi:MAG: hypothetical protein J6C13_03155 [Clostridia bacterium]|nr:hypothetical protein [Clostridia bacterium]
MNNEQNHKNNNEFAVFLIQDFNIKDTNLFAKFFKKRYNVNFDIEEIQNQESHSAIFKVKDLSVYNSLILQADRQISILSEQYTVFKKNIHNISWIDIQGNAQRLGNAPLLKIKDLSKLELEYYQKVLKTIDDDIIFSQNKKDLLIFTSNKFKRTSNSILYELMRYRLNIIKEIFSFHKIDNLVEINENNTELLMPCGKIINDENITKSVKKYLEYSIGQNNEQEDTQQK